MKNVNSSLYIEQAKQGDTTAFAWIVSTYSPMIWTIAMNILNNREDAEDLTQEIFIKLFKSLNQYKAEAEFSTWIYRIAYNTSLSEIRKRKIAWVSIEENIVSIDEPDETDLPDTEIKLQHLEEAIKKLSPEEQFLVSLYYKEDLPVGAIAKISQLSESNIKVKLYRARKKLAIEINQLME